jgi:hypothetical protein
LQVIAADGDRECNSFTIPMYQVVTDLHAAGLNIFVLSLSWPMHKVSSCSRTDDIVIGSVPL